MDNDTKKAALIRLRRKLDIMRLDAKNRQDDKAVADTNECIALVDILERAND